MQICLDTISGVSAFGEAQIRGQVRSQVHQLGNEEGAVSDCALFGVSVPLQAGLFEAGASGTSALPGWSLVTRSLRSTRRGGADAD